MYTYVPYLCIVHVIVPVSFVNILYRTFLKDCPFVIKVRATKDGQKLYIKEISEEHNHELSEVRIMYCMLPSNYRKYLM